MINLSECNVLFHDFYIVFFKNQLFQKIHTEYLQCVNQFGTTSIRSDPMFYTSIYAKNLFCLFV